MGDRQPSLEERVEMKAIQIQKDFLLPRDHTLFNNCHASSITTLSGGELIAAFFAGLREGESDVGIWLARTEGGVWQMPARLLAEDGLAHWNPVLHRAGDKVWLFYKVGPSVHTWITRWTVSSDLGRSWSLPLELVPGDTLPRGPVRNKLIVLSNGEWIAPGSLEMEEVWDSFVDISADLGRSWRKHDVPIDHRERGTVGNNERWDGLAANALWETDATRIFKWDGVIQPSLWESAPGRVHMLMRSTRGFVYRSDSSDHGRSWCPAYATTLPNNNSGIDVVRLDDGGLVLAYNPVAGNWGRRYPISLGFSSDNGESWTKILDMESDEGEFSYPAIIADGERLHLTYTWNRKNIVYQQLILA
jgi:predicted neuraminidase